MMTSFDERRDIISFENSADAIIFSVENFIKLASEAIAVRKVFTVALSGGSTPKTIFQLLTSPEYRHKVDWQYVKLFWSDERCVSPEDAESNYRMAMEAGFTTLPIPSENIFRMETEGANLEALEIAALKYEALIATHVPNKAFDLVMLGMGDDGHTASLFPKTHGLKIEGHLAIANFIPQKNTWRMTLTFECINSARAIVIYVLGAGKAAMLHKIFNNPYDPNSLPIQKIGTAVHKALWITDQPLC